MDALDVVVVGAGPAGEVAAGRCAEGGLRGALMERELVGGECSFWGCIPSKTLIRPGDVLASARRAPGASAAVAGGIDVDAALAWRDETTNRWHDDNALPWPEEQGITLLRGSGRLAGEREVEVSSSDGPRDNRSATSVNEAPRRLLVLGGGRLLRARPRHRRDREDGGRRTAPAPCGRGGRLSPAPGCRSCCTRQPSRWSVRYRWTRSGTPCRPSRPSARCGCACSRRTGSSDRHA